MYLHISTIYVFDTCLKKIKKKHSEAIYIKSLAILKVVVKNIYTRGCRVFP